MLLAAQTLMRTDAVSLGSVFQEIVYHRSLLELIDMGFLSRPEAISVEVPAFHPRTVVDVWEEHVLGTGRASTLVGRKHLNTTPFKFQSIFIPIHSILFNYYSPYHFYFVPCCLGVSHRDQRSTHPRRLTLILQVFAENVEAVDDITRAFLSAGVTAIGVSGGTDITVRGMAVDRFRRQELSVLVNCGVFTEGTDIPCVDCVILARATRSETLFQQMVGRGLRQHPGKDSCLVIDLHENLQDNRLTTVPHLQGLEPEYDIKIAECTLEANQGRDDSDGMPTSAATWPPYTQSRLVGDTGYHTCGLLVKVRVKALSVWSHCALPLLRVSSAHVHQRSPPTHTDDAAPAGLSLARPAAAARLPHVSNGGGKSFGLTLETISIHKLCTDFASRSIWMAACLFILKNGGRFASGTTRRTVTWLRQKMHHHDSGWSGC